jgi:uncharacterized protein involved in exopolysaccharide biosynthesis
MTVERDLPRGRRVPVDELEEQDVDVRGYWDRISGRWWLPVGGLLIGLLLGLLLAAGGGKVYRAEATIYLGNPFTPNGTAPVQALAAQPSIVNNTIHSENIIGIASQRSGMGANALRNGVTSRTIGAAKKSGAGAGTNSLYVISVTGSNKVRTQKAANALAFLTVGKVSPYVNTKIDSLKGQLTAQQGELDSIEARIEAANEAYAAGKSLSALDKLVLVTVVDNAEQRRATIENEILATKQLLNLANQVEKAKVIETATAVPTTARSKRNSAIAGALLGLLIGLIVAILWDPVAERRRRPA